MKNPLLLALVFVIFFFPNVKAQPYAVEAGTDPATLVNMLTGGLVTTSNITYQGHVNARGRFWGSSNIGMGTGVILATGHVSNSAGPNNVGNKSTNLNTGGDPALTTLGGNPSHDAAILQFDFIPSGSTFKLKLVLASEEYPEFVNQTNDVFGVFLSGPGISGTFPAPAGFPNGSINIAIIDPTVTPPQYISINNINNGFSNNGPCENCQYYVSNGTGSTPTLNPFIQYDSFTTVFEIGYSVTPNQTYHLKLSIADILDYSYDSGLYFEEGSLIASAPGIAGPITGPATVCYNSLQVTYSVEEIPGATAYVWTLPSGVTGSSTTNSITVDFTPGAVSGAISVCGTNVNGNGTASSLNVAIDPLPGIPEAITGPAEVCKNQSGVIYTVPPVANADTYQWSLPAGASGTSSTSSITVSFGSNAVSGNITVTGINDCGTGTSTSLAITVNSLPVQAGSITGPQQVCKNQTDVVYTVPVIENAISYTWNLPAGATGTSTTNSITVSFGANATSGNISVYGTNDCGQGNASSIAITVNELPGNAGSIQGQEQVCKNQSNLVYTVPSIQNATTYVWSLPPGATGNSTTNSINVAYGPNAQSGIITVSGSNLCGSGVSSGFAITVMPLPDDATYITGIISVCQGDEGLGYFAEPIPNATSYIWTLPPGAAGTSLTNTIVVSYGENAASGNILVAGANICGMGESVYLPVTVLEKPSAPVIHLVGDTLFSDAAEGNQWYDHTGLIPGATQQNYIVTWDDNYYTMVTLDGCTSDASNTLTVIVSSVEANEQLNGMKIYPNPFSESLTIEKSGAEEQEFEIINASGIVVSKGSIRDNTTIDAGGFSPGIYIIRVYGSHGVNQMKLMKR